MGNSVQVDSLVANEFTVELNGADVTGIFRVSGLTTFATDSEGKRIKPTFTISKMVERDANNPFNTWLRETTGSWNSDQKPRRDVTIVAVDDGVVTRRWTAKGAWIQHISYSDFDSASNEMVSENFVIAYDDMEEEWTAS